LSFADGVKDAVATIFGWSRALLEGDTNESREFRETVDPFWSARFGENVTPRMMLQKMGTEAGREVFHSDIWIHSLERRMLDHENVVIPDVRFPNEMKFIKKAKGFVIRVTRNKHDPEWYNVALKANKENNPDLMKDYPIHYSEWAWIGQDYHYTLINDGSIAMLEADVKHLLRLFTGPAIIQKS
jgi:hypothetical protein